MAEFVSGKYLSQKCNTYSITIDEEDWCGERNPLYERALVPEYTFTIKCHTGTNVANLQVVAVMVQDRAELNTKNCMPKQETHTRLKKKCDAICFII